MFEAGLFGTIEDIVLGAGNALERGGYAIGEMFRGTSSSGSVEEKENAEDVELEKRKLAVASEWFDTIEDRVIKKDGRFLPSFEKFMADHFKDQPIFENDMAKTMMKYQDTYKTMVSRISSFFGVSEKVVMDTIHKYQGSGNNLAGTLSANNINIDFDAIDYIKEGEDIMKILMDIDAGKIDALKGIDMIKSMSNNNVTLDIGKFVTDIEARVRNASKEETRIEPTSLPDVVDKKTVNLREAVESTPLGKRLFTNVEPEVVTV